MRRHLIAAALAAAAFAAGPLAGAAEGSKQTTLRGELVDTRCYLEHKGAGAKHQQCASMCAKEGIPVGLLTSEGKLYVLIVNAPALASVMADEAEVTGTVSGDTIVPATLKVKKGESWKEVELPEHM